MMVNPFFSYYLAFSLASIDMADALARLWRDLFASHSLMPMAMGRERWLSRVGARTTWARKPAVYNCAAAAYNASGLDLSQLAAANACSWRKGSRCSTR